MKKKRLKLYMTFRDGKPLNTSSLFEEVYNLYKEKAPIWQDGDKSVPVIIEFNQKNSK